MPKFQVVHNSDLAPGEAFEKLNAFLGQASEIAKFDAAAKWQGNPGENTGSIKGKQFSAKVQVKPQGSGSEVIFDLDIALLLTPLKGKITEVLQAKLKKHLV